MAKTALSFTSSSFHNYYILPPLHNGQAHRTRIPTGTGHFLAFLRFTHRSVGFGRINYQLAAILGRQPPVQESSRDRPGP